MNLDYTLNNIRTQLEHSIRIAERNLLEDVQNSNYKSSWENLKFMVEMEIEQKSQEYHELLSENSMLNALETEGFLRAMKYIQSEMNRLQPLDKV